MAEDPRQGVKLKFAGKSYTFRPTFEVLVGIEAATNQASRALGMKYLNAEASLIEIAATMQVLLADSGVKPEEIGEALVEEGYGELLLPLGLFLTRAQRGNKEHEKEALKQAKAGEGEGEGGAASGDPQKP